jgi:hypothetical protein
MADIYMEKEPRFPMRVSIDCGHSFGRALNDSDHAQKEAGEEEPFPL